MLKKGESIVENQKLKESLYSFTPIKSDIQIIPFSTDSRRGNSYGILYPDNTIDVLDIGCQFSTIKRILKEHNLKVNDIKRLFITHTHSDHILGMPAILQQKGWGHYDINKKPYKYVHRNVFMPHMDALDLPKIKSHPLPHMNAKDRQLTHNKAYFINGVLYLTDLGTYTKFNHTMKDGTPYDSNALEWC